MEQKKQRSVIRSLWSEVMKAGEIFRRWRFSTSI